MTRSGLWLFVASACTVPSVVNGVKPIVACATDGDCLAGYHCQSGACQQPDRACSLSSDCDSDQHCQLILDGGLCLQTTVPYCKACVASSECAHLGGFCAPLGQAHVCSQACDSCDAGSSCQAIEVPDAGMVSTCLPISGACP